MHSKFGISNKVIITLSLIVQMFHNYLSHVYNDIYYVGQFGFLQLSLACIENLFRTARRVFKEWSDTGKLLHYNSIDRPIFLFMAEGIDVSCAPLTGSHTSLK